jgi:hypothetical protein
MTYKIKDNEVAVSREIYWLPIDKDTPRSVKVLAINKERCGVAQFAELHHHETWFDHWHPLPRFQKGQNTDRK